MSEKTQGATESIESPPPAAMPARESASDADPRHALRQLAIQLMRCRNRKLLVQFLQMRSALR